MPPDFELFDDETRELFIVLNGVEFKLAEIAPELQQQVEAAGGIDALDVALWNNILTQGDWRPRLREIAGQRSIGPQFPPSEGATTDPGAPIWWTPEVARILDAGSWQAYLDEATRPLTVAEAGLTPPSRSERLRDAIKVARDIAQSLGIALDEPREKPDGTFATGFEAQQAARTEGVEDAVILRDPETGRWTWDFPEIDPIARQVFTTEAAARAAAPDGFRPRPFNSAQGTIWGFERIPEAAAPPRRSLNQIIDENIISGNVARAMELVGLQRMVEATPEALSLEEATTVATEFSDNAEEFRELFQLLTREQRTAAAVAPLQLGQIQERFAQVTAARAGLLGDLPPELPEIFPGLGLPGGETDFAAGATGQQLFPDQPEVAAAFNRGATGPSAIALARERLGRGVGALNALTAETLGVLTTRRGFEEPDFVEGERRIRPVFIEDILGIAEVPREAIEGLTLEMFRELSGITRPGALRTIFGKLRAGAGLEGDPPTEADIGNLLGERREAGILRAETERVEAEATAEREAEEQRQTRTRERRVFTGPRRFV